MFVKLEMNNIDIDRKIHITYMACLGNAGTAAKKETINAIIEELRAVGVLAKIVNQQSNYEEPITLSISIQNSSGVYASLGIFTIDFNCPKPTFNFEIPNYTKNFSNAIVYSFLSSWFKSNVLQTLTDDEFKFIAQLETLEKALAEKKFYNSREEKKLFDALEHILPEIHNLQMRDPQKTGALTQALTIFNKIVNCQASPKDIDTLFEDIIKKQLAIKYSSTFSGPGITLAVGIVGIILLAVGMIGAATTSLFGVFIPLFLLGAISLLGVLSGGVDLIVKDSAHAPLLNNDLRITINNSGLVLKESISQKNQPEPKSPVYGADVFSSTPTTSPQTETTTTTPAVTHGKEHS